MRSEPGHRASAFVSPWRDDPVDSRSALLLIAAARGSRGIEPLRVQFRGAASCRRS
jgi:hypothetical protein